ncbi:MAG: 2OG-Fe(II) oxygenase [Planctomycetaceae bacterium]
MAGVSMELLEVLKGLGDSAAYCATGTVGAVLPGLHVEGVGDVGVPVSAEDAKRLIKQAAQAPYGRGEETVVDPNVRRVWQLEPSQFALRNAEWKSSLALIVEAVRQEFGIAQKVESQLYKLLVYEQGSFFAPHRDTEKAERMFATLVVCLPSKHEGGTLIVSHDGQTKRIDFGGEASRFQMQYAAFYADCQHEITPVTSGYRVCLVYNLAIAKSKQQPSAPVNSEAIDRAAEALTKIFADQERDKIAIPLKHQYTEAGLGDVEGASVVSNVGAKERGDTGEPPVLRLKGGDQARMDVLARAAEKVGYQANLALLTHWQSGSVDCSSIDYEPSRSRRRGYRDIDDDDDFDDDDDDMIATDSGAEFEEVYDETMELSHWFDSAGRKLSFQELKLEEAEIVSDVAAKDRPCRQEVHEATGNEGVSMERWYHQAVVVIWPRDRYFGILAGAGPASAVPALEELVRRTEPPADNNECCQFAKEIIARWRKQTGTSVNSWDVPSGIDKRNDKKSLVARMMQVLQVIGDETLALTFVCNILPIDCDGTEGAELTRLVDQFGWGQFAESLSEFFAKQKPGDYGRKLVTPVVLFESLCCSAPRRTKERLSVCRSLADELEQVIERWDRHVSNAWQGEQGHRLGIVEPIVRALTAIEATEVLDRFVARAISDPKHYDLHAVLIPAVKTLSSDADFNDPAQPAIGRSACERLQQHCLSELRTRTAAKPQPPADWSREATLSCQCADCRELAVFLKNKDESVHRFARRKELRQHLHREIDKHQCEVTHVTEHRGSPQTLVCTKTQTRYEGCLKQFETDVRFLGELERLSTPTSAPNTATKTRRRVKNI